MPCVSLAVGVSPPTERKGVIAASPAAEPTVVSMETHILVSTHQGCSGSLTFLFPFKDSLFIITFKALEGRQVSESCEYNSSLAEGTSWSHLTERPTAGPTLESGATLCNPVRFKNKAQGALRYWLLGVTTEKGVSLARGQGRNPRASGGGGHVSPPPPPLWRWDQVWGDVRALLPSSCVQ